MSTFITTQQPFTFSKLAMGTLEQHVKSVKKLTIKTQERPHQRHSGDVIANLNKFHILFLYFHC